MATPSLQYSGAILAGALLVGCGDSSSGAPSKGAKGDASGAETSSGGTGASANAATGSGGSAGTGNGAQRSAGTGNGAQAGTGNGAQHSAGGQEQGASGGAGGSRVDTTTDGAAGEVGDAGADAVRSCSFTSPPAVPAPLDPAASVQAQQTHGWLMTLDALVGQYLRGDVEVYRGTLKASDNTSAVYEAVGQTEPDGVISNEPALARLEYRPASDSDYPYPKTAVPGDAAILVVHGVTEQKHLVFSQGKANPSLTEASTIADHGSFHLLELACTACAPSFWGNPAAIAFDVSTTGTATVFQGIVGQGGHDVEVPLHMTAEAKLAFAPPCTLRFDDLAMLNTNVGPNESVVDFGMTSFHREGREMVWHAVGTISGQQTTGRCFLSTPYTVDLFIDLDDLAHYGTRNLVLGAERELCAP